MVEEVWRRARRSQKIDRLVIATDDRRILDTATAFGADVELTSPDHPSGTDRVAEVARSAGERFGIVVNIQGDEPLLTPTSLDRLIDCFSGDSPPQMATLAEPIETADELFDPNVVKLVTRSDGQALYFSRSPIPFHRGDSAKLSADFRAALAARKGGLGGFRKHQGIYAYTRETLLALTRLEPSSLERDEGLEQLRALQSGYSIQVVDSDFRSMSVDTPADLERVIARRTEAD
jgi:3-deoxy-manno-octulosonate cytidylyltransferase (CMP-KDO synthetase)